MVGLAPDTTLHVTKFPSARVLKVSFQRLDEAELQTIPWLEQLVALPQLTRVMLNWGDISPGRFLMQLPAGCELEIDTWGRKLSESLPPSASLAHLVTLEVRNCYRNVDFSCLATCPNLRSVKLRPKYVRVRSPLDWVKWSTLNHVPDLCSLVLNFRGAAMRIGAFYPPAGWSVAPQCTSPESKDDELIFFRNNRQDCFVESDM